MMNSLIVKKNHPHLFKVGVIAIPLFSLLPFEELSATPLAAAGQGFLVAESQNPVKKKASLRKRRKRALRVKRKKNESIQQIADTTDADTPSQDDALSVEKSEIDEVSSSVHRHGHLIKVK